MSSVKSKRIGSVSKADAERFWSQVERNANERGCWLWTGSCNSKGYGRFFLEGRHYYAHRVSWRLASRDVPRELQICHTCDNRLCVNPDHLLMADNATNQRDAKLKRNLDGKHALAKKPYDSFPLFPHATRRWAKKISGKLHYFGSTVNDPDGQAALDLYLAQKDDLYAGRKPRVSHDTYTVADLCEDFMCSRERRMNDGEITARTFHDYHTVCQRIVKQFGRNRAVDDLGPEDFGELRRTLGKAWGPTTIANEIQRIRVVFNFGYKQKKLDRPVAFGEEFRRPPKKVLRRTRRKNGKRMLEAAELRQVIAKANQPMRAMILLAANGGLGQSDLSALPLRTLEEAVETGWLDFPRPKTEVERRFPLWPETVAACKEALDKRPKPAGKDEASLAFLTRLGAAWVKSRTKVDLTDEGEEKPETRRLIVEDAVGREFAKLLNDLGVKRLGVNFYAIRHGFETVAGDSRDQVAVNHVMGHADASMAAEYRETVADERLRNVVAVVHAWLFGK